MFCATCYFSKNGPESHPLLKKVCSGLAVTVYVVCYRFAPSLVVTVYVGDQDERSRIRKGVRRSAPDILLTTYDLCLRDNFFFEKRVYNTVIVDEGHRYAVQLFYEAFLTS